jgi:glycosyltransferase involved in cell wall biosynthesis
MRVAIVHHWFVTQGGGERVAECLAALFPQAELFTLVAGPRGLPPSLRNRRLHTSFLQRIPGAVNNHRHFMPLYPAATRSLDLRGFDLVFSSDSGPVKGVRLDAGAVQICYCHSPMRYLYDSYEAYRATMPPLTRAIFTATAARVRRADLAAAARVTYFLANSNYVAARIRRFYGAEAEVIHPPIDLTLAQAATPGDHYLAAGRLVAYKRTDLILAACLQLGRKLRIAGEGPELARLRQQAAAHPNAGLVTFLGALSHPDLWQQYATCRALLFAADEDFGMIPLEAQACGRPVVCYGAGGSLETVRGAGAEPTGIYFAEQTAASLIAGIEDYESRQECFSPAAAQRWAASFATPIFLDNIRRAVLSRIPAAAPALSTVAQALSTL